MLDDFVSDDWYKSFIQVRFRGNDEAVQTALENFSHEVQAKAVAIATLIYAKENDHVQCSGDIESCIQVR